MEQDEESQERATAVERQRNRGWEIEPLKSDIITMTPQISMCIIIPLHVRPKSSSNQIEIIDSTHPRSPQNGNDIRPRRTRGFQGDRTIRIKHNQNYT
jgi:hypothetical protein